MRPESTPPVGKSRRAAAPAHVSLPEGRKAHDAPSVSALPKRVMAAATLAKMVVGTRMRSGGEGGGEGGGGSEGGSGNVKTLGPWAVSSEREGTVVHYQAWHMHSSTSSLT